MSRTFDRIPSPPSESHLYPIRALTSARTIVVREVHWRLTPDFPLDQGEQGACVGFGTSAELSAEPVALPTGTPFAFELYRRAQEQDRAMGYHFPEGATVLAGLRAARAMGLIQGFRWAQRFEDIRDALLTHGSVVAGTDWTDGMYEPDRSGLLRVTGDSIGGHCWALVGYVPAHPVFGEVYEGVNSWGPDWGLNGRFLIPAADLRRLYDRNGEFAIVTDTPQAPTPPPPAIGSAYFAAPRSTVFHRSKHGGFRRAVEFGARDDAVAAGFRPCRTCRP